MRQAAIVAGIIALAVGGYSGPTRASASSEQTWRLAGLGTNSCASFLAVLPSTPTVPPHGAISTVPVTPVGGYLQWIEGFLSGADYLHTSEPQQIHVGSAGVLAWIRDYCESSPNRSVADAAAAFIATDRPTPVE